MFKTLVIFLDKFFLRFLVQTKITLNHKKYLKKINLNNDYVIKIYHPKDRNNILAKLADEYGSDKGEVSQKKQHILGNLTLTNFRINFF